MRIMNNSLKITIITIQQHFAIQTSTLYIPKTKDNNQIRPLQQNASLFQQSFTLRV